MKRIGAIALMHFALFIALAMGRALWRKTIQHGRSAFSRLILQAEFQTLPRALSPAS